MSVWNVKRTWDRPFFVYCKKHPCPVCGKELEKVRVSRVVNPKSEEAKEFDFSFGDSHLIGTTRFVWTEFHCEPCQRSYRVQELYKLEKVKK